MKLFHRHHEKAGPEAELLKAEHLAIAFDRPILRDVSLHLTHGETLAVMGKSGTGKSVLLKLIVGLLYPDAGRILYKGKDVTSMNEDELMATRSEIGFLFQGAALFDSMTIGQNIDLMLVKHTDLESQERETKIIESLEMVGLADAIDKMPSELSGGMRKRAGLARAIVLEPELILYDEPTTGLDPLTASSIAELILELQTRLGIASVVVTHDLPTAFTVSDRAIILNEGLVIFDGKIETLEHSDDPFLKSYLQASRMDRARRDEIVAMRRSHGQKEAMPHETALEPHTY